MLVLKYLKDIPTPLSFLNFLRFIKKSKFFVTQIKGFSPESIIF